MSDLEQIQGSDGEVYFWIPTGPRASAGFSKVYNAETVDGVRHVFTVVNIRDDDTTRWYAGSRLAEREIDIAARIEPGDDGHLWLTASLGADLAHLTLVLERIIHICWAAGV